MSTGIDLVGVRAGYGAVEVLHDVSLSFPLGTVVALLGRNGAGKSSMLRVVAGTIPMSAGHVLWRGHDITGLAPHERTAAGLTTLPDGFNVFPGLSVEENLALFGHGVPADPVYAVFPELSDKRTQASATLSGGERQMLALGRLLLAPGNALLLDEVSSGLSPGAITRLYGVIDDLATPDRVVVVVEQYRPDILRRADLVYVLSRGAVAWAGEPGELRAGHLPLSLA